MMSLPYHAHLQETKGKLQIRYLKRYIHWNRFPRNTCLMQAMMSLHCLGKP
ncbi:unnamed protein product [Acanthoscelides obtectus]|uniref:Uncharacterized protein n=1 Tax=Acanthoscelides obtectus TaxID=200917 RepID=A0A9P0QD00_ACAOB|nr:unnamed protein product [Acanthoscelides obtectus]CAH2011831.1 unnamed protein product [Acanthoscelides obtectus]CAH2017330.1 unnamed protein product [Acanthoscelides obtectus]CAK1627095.1 hypothetical protein AOBTE_LOCUS4300 [Acanthoscelides obtectus]CAK1639291.1 hypothetical protein AOBTE_LOCUS11104 [Acanthoscelides obtectus]